jgi:hypothetical protein
MFQIFVMLSSRVNCVSYYPVFFLSPGVLNEKVVWICLKQKQPHRQLTSSSLKLTSQDQEPLRLRRGFYLTRIIEGLLQPPPLPLVAPLLCVMITTTWLSYIFVRFDNTLSKIPCSNMWMLFMVVAHSKWLLFNKKSCYSYLIYMCKVNAFSVVKYARNILMLTSYFTQVWI